MPYALIIDQNPKNYGLFKSRPINEPQYWKNIIIEKIREVVVLLTSSDSLIYGKNIPIDFGWTQTFFKKKKFRKSEKVIFWASKMVQKREIFMSGHLRRFLKIISQ